MFTKIIAFFKSFFVPKDEGNFGLYKPKERWIYRYWDGQKIRPVDPLTLYKRLMSDWAAIDIDVKVARSKSKDNRSSHDKLIGRLRTVFEVPEKFEGGGLTEQELMDLFDHFLTFIGYEKKSMNQSTIQSEAPSPTTPSPSVPPSSGSSEGNQPTKSSSDSGSTGQEPNINKPMQSTSEQPPPLVQ